MLDGKGLKLEVCYHSKDENIMIDERLLKKRLPKLHCNRKDG